MLTAVAIAVAVVASLALAQMASAAANPVASGGKTTITLNSGLVNKLKKSKVKLSAVKPTTVSGKTVTLPIEAGSSIDTAGAGELLHEGGLKFKAGKKSTTVTGLVLATSTNTVTAKVGGKVMPFAKVSGVSASRNGFGTNVSASSLKLTSKAATQLNKKLGLPTKTKKKKNGKKVKGTPAPFKSNQVVGKSASETQPKTIGIASGSATLNVDLGSAIKLAEVNVKLTPIAPTTAISEIPPIVQFPMGAGGSISPDGKQGSVRTSGGLLLSQKPAAFGGEETKMTLGDIWIELSTGRATVEVIVESNVEPEPGKGAPANLGSLGRASIGALDMTGAAIKSDEATHTVTVENGKASLEETTATVLNSVFGKFEGKEPFKAGDPLGVFSFTATTE